MVCSFVILCMIIIIIFGRQRLILIEIIVADRSNWCHRPISYIFIMYMSPWTALLLVKSTHETYILFFSMCKQIKSNAVASLNLLWVYRQVWLTGGWSMFLCLLCSSHSAFVCFMLFIYAETHTHTRSTLCVQSAVNGPKNWKWISYVSRSYLALQQSVRYLYLYAQRVRRLADTFHVNRKNSLKFANDLKLLKQILERNGCIVENIKNAQIGLSHETDNNDTTSEH